MQSYKIVISGRYVACNTFPSEWNKFEIHCEWAVWMTYNEYMQIQCRIISISNGYVLWTYIAGYRPSALNDMSLDLIAKYMAIGTAHYASVKIEFFLPICRRVSYVSRVLPLASVSRNLNVCFLLNACLISRCSPMPLKDSCTEPSWILPVFALRESSGMLD